MNVSCWVSNTKSSFDAICRLLSRMDLLATLSWLGWQKSSDDDNGDDDDDDDDNDDDDEDVLVCKCVSSKWNKVTEDHSIKTLN